MPTRGRGANWERGSLTARRDRSAHPKLKRRAPIRATDIAYRHYAFDGYHCLAYRCEHLADLTVRLDVTSAPPREASRDHTQARPRQSASKITPFTLLAVLPFLLFGLIFAVYPLSQVVRMSLSDVQIRSGQF